MYSWRRRELVVLESRMNLEELLSYFGEAIKDLDASGIPHKEFKPGAGPYGEPQLVRACVRFLSEKYPLIFGQMQTKRSPDILIPDKWGIELKIVRPFGDNAKEAEHWSQNLLHPYPGNTSSIGDVFKLAQSDIKERKAVIVVAFEQEPPSIDLEILVSCFEEITRNVLQLPISQRATVEIGNLIHPVHNRCVLYGWEVHP